NVRRLQIDKLARLKKERNQEGGARGLGALARSASEGNGNLLVLAIDAARAKATVGETPGARERVFGRPRAEIKAITGAYRREPPQDYEALSAAGAEAICPPGTVIADAAEELIRKLNVRLGHSEAAE